MKVPNVLKTKCYLSALFALSALSMTEVQAQSTWNSSTGTWSTDLNWNPVAVPANSNTTQLIFEASDGNSYTTTNDIGAATFNLNKITVNNTGTGTVTISGASTANTLTFGGANPTLDITGRVLFTGLLAGAPTITKTGTGTFIHDSNNGTFTGTIIINQGTFVNRATTVTPTNFNPVSIVVNDGATYQFGENGTGDPNLPNSTYVTVNTGGMVSWQEGEQFGGFHLQGGTINLLAGATSQGSTVQSWTSGTLTGTGAFVITGTASTNKTTSGTVNITGNAAINTTGTLNILDGTVSMAGAVNLGTANVTLGDNGGTTKGTFDYQGDSATRVGNFAINAGDGVINVGNSTTVLTLSGIFSGAGDLTKTGAGKLRISGPLGYTGTTTISAGSLQIEPGTAFGPLVVGNDAALSVNSGLGTVSLTAPSINLAGTSTLQFDLDTNAVAPAALMTVATADGLTFTGTPTLKLTNLQSFANGTYTILDYNGTGITTGFKLALPGRTLGNLIYDTANTRIDVAISGTDTIKWKGAVNGDWDLGTGAGVGGTNNWQLVTAGTATNFIDTDSVTFDDTATSQTVNLTTTLRPLATIVNASANYTFSGPGKISGPTALNKSGTGILVLATDNDFTGNTTISGGSVQLGNGGTTGSVTGIVTLNAGNLAFNRSDDYSFTNTLVVNGTSGLVQNGTGIVTVPTALNTAANEFTFGGSGNLTMAAAITGNGIINKEGTGTLTLLANNNPFTGTLNVNGGTVLLDDLGGGGDLGALSIVVNNGGTFIFGDNGNADLPDATLVTINSGGVFRIEQGENFAGYILNGGEFRHVGANSTGVTTVAGTTVYDLRSGTITSDGNGAMNQTGGGVLTKTTSGTVTVSGSVTFQATLALQIKEGTLAMNTNNVPATGAALISLGDLTTIGALKINGSGTASSFRTFTLGAGGGLIDVADTGTSLTLNGTISGAGSLSKAGNGSLILAGGNDYAGGTTVASGILELNNFFGSGTGTGGVIVNGTLAGEGGIITDIGKSVQLNGTLQVGSSIAGQGTDFGITAGTGGSTIFGASSVARFDLWSTTGTDQSFNPAAADLLLLSGDVQLTLGATLKLTNPGALTFQVGDVFRIFDWSGLGTRTGAWAVDSTDLNLNGLMVDTTNLYSAGTIGIIAVPEPSAGLLIGFGVSLLGLRRRRSN